MNIRTPTTISAQTTTATLEWDDNGLPVSSHFKDVYFSTASGIAETRYVFLHRNQLNQRFMALANKQTFTIAETGFGTGLNFLCAWQLFDKIALNDCLLHFISTEKYPLTPGDMQRALTLFPELEPYTSEFKKAYQLPTTKQLCLSFSDGRVQLTLLIGDVLDTLPAVEQPVNAWFLDGFAPAKNPDMWQPSLFQTMATKSANGATYATFTAARMVQNGLSSAGFTINKCSGFGAKRDMICGQFLPELSRSTATLPWFAFKKHNDPDKKAVVIGGGLAGTSCAFALAERGWQVELLEQHNQLAQEASGNAQGILYAKLSAGDTPLSQFILEGYHYTLSLLERLNLQEWDQCGVIQLATEQHQIKRHRSLNQQHSDQLLKYMTQHQLSEIAGIPVQSDGLYFPRAGWINPPAFCRAMANHPNITVKTNITVEQLQKNAQGWDVISGETKVANAKTVIIAEGTASNQLPQVQHLPLKAIRGQVSRVIATQSSSQLTTCVCGKGYIAPSYEGYHSMGATFNIKDDSPDISHRDHQKNLALQAYAFPAMYSALGTKNAIITGGRVGFRCTTPDYLPVVGGIIDYKPFIEKFAPLRTNKKHRFSDYAHYLDGLYISSGHGSRGLLSCPLSGEILAAIINNDLLPVEESLLYHLNPTRFLVRDLARNKI